ncbi:MAG: multifunctional 2-oxoglutarate metabolism enzyme, partial [Frankiaceae bacterium]|nr:multifunctional 2-oxoglutarate metabolism enzyme [Frankiaceae bacterium]
MTTSVNPATGPDFGPNEWLVHEIWQQYRDDPDSVSPEWREFLSDYRPVDGPGPSTPSGQNQDERDDAAAAPAKSAPRAATGDAAGSPAKGASGSK